MNLIAKCQVCGSTKLVQKYRISLGDAPDWVSRPPWGVRVLDGCYCADCGSAYEFNTSRAAKVRQ